MYLCCFFFEFSPFQYNENRSDTKVLPNNTFIASRPITTNYSKLRPVSNPQFSMIYNNILNSFLVFRSILLRRQILPSNFVFICLFVCLFVCCTPSPYVHCIL